MLESLLGKRGSLDLVTSISYCTSDQKDLETVALLLDKNKNKWTVELMDKLFLEHSSLRG